MIDVKKYREMISNLPKLTNRKKRHDNKPPPLMLWDEAVGDVDKSVQAGLGALKKIGLPKFVMISFTPIIVMGRAVRYRGVIIGARGYIFLSGAYTGFKGKATEKMFNLLKRLGIPEDIAGLVFRARKLILFNYNGVWYADPITREGY